MEARFFRELRKRVPGLDDWYHQDADGTPWMMVSYAFGPPGLVVGTLRLDFDGWDLRGGWSPADSNWDDGVRADDAQVDTGPPDGTWPNLTGHFKPHDYRHTHATILENSDVKKVLQMDRRGHATAGMDAVYVHVTDDMRQHLCDVLEGLWRAAIAERYQIAPRSAVPILDEILLAYAQTSSA